MSNNTGKNNVNWFVYIIRCTDGSLYTGISTDPKRRFTEHKKDKSKGAKYFRSTSPETIVFKKKCKSKSLALKYEIHIKQKTKVQKEQIVSTGKIEKLK
jgi:putative endonuclease